MDKLYSDTDSRQTDMLGIQVIPPTIAAYASLYNDFPLLLVEIGRQSNEQEDNCCSTFEVGVQSIATAIRTDEG